MAVQHWETVYSNGKQLNKFPFPEVVSFFLRNKSETSLSQPRALDVGCGSGVHSAFLADNGAEVTAFDFSASSVAFAKQMFSRPEITFKVAGIENAPIEMKTFDFVVDHCASTHTTLSTTSRFYQGIKENLEPGAHLFWRGFADDNGLKKFGKRQDDGSYRNFTESLFKPLGQVTFFTEDDLHKVFEGYQIRSLRHLSDKDVSTGLAHTSWIVEVNYEN